MKSLMNITKEDFQLKCKTLRKQIIEMSYKAQKGHIPTAFSSMEILVSLYYSIMKIDKDFSNDRDRMILSKGHGCMALYVIFAELGLIDKKELDYFCHPKGILGGHPSRRKVKGIEASTGSLGMGPSLGIGMALALRKEKSTRQVFVVVGDGECNEGSVWEAALCANKNKLDNYWIIVDYNKFQSYGPTDEICPLGQLEDKWKSFGFNTVGVDLKVGSLNFLEAYETLKNQPGPKCIVCHTIKGQGSKTLEGNLEYHHIRSMDEKFKNQLLEEVETYA